MPRELNKPMHSQVLSVPGELNKPRHSPGVSGELKKPRHSPGMPGELIKQMHYPVTKCAWRTEYVKAFSRYKVSLDNWKRQGIRKVLVVPGERMLVELNTPRHSPGVPGELN